MCPQRNTNGSLPSKRRLWACPRKQGRSSTRPRRLWPEKPPLGFAANPRPCNRVLGNPSQTRKYNASIPALLRMPWRLRGAFPLLWPPTAAATGQARPQADRARSPYDRGKGLIPCPCLMTARLITGCVCRFHPISPPALQCIREMRPLGRVSRRPNPMPHPPTGNHV